MTKSTRVVTRLSTSPDLSNWPFASALQAHRMRVTSALQVHCIHVHRMKDEVFLKVYLYSICIAPANGQMNFSQKQINCKIVTFSWQLTSPTVPAVVLSCKFIFSAYFKLIPTVRAEIKYSCH